MTSRSRHLSQPCSQVSRPSTNPLENDYSSPGKRLLAPWKTTTCPLKNDYLPPGKRLLVPWKTTTRPLENDYLPPGKRLLVPWKTTTCPLENDYLPPGKRLLAPWKTSRREPLKRDCALASFSIFQQNQYKETEIRFHFKVKIDLPGFCFTPYNSILIQNLLWLLFATNRSHLVNKPSLIMFVFSVSLSSFPEKI